MYVLTFSTTNPSTVGLYVIYLSWSVNLLASNISTVAYVVSITFITLNSSDFSTHIVKPGK